MKALTRFAFLALAAIVASSPGVNAQDGTLRGANYVYPRSTASKRAPSRVMYRRKGPKLDADAAADARIGVTFWQARPASADEPARTRDIVQTDSGTKAWSLVRVSGEPALGVGEEFRVGIETLRSGYLYVVNRPIHTDGATGDPYLIFPTRRIRGGNNRVRAGLMVMLPTPPDEPPFAITDPRGDLAAEEVIILVTPAPLDLPIGDDRSKISAALVDEWVARWSVPSESFEIVDDNGARYTPAEKAAATTPGRLLDAGDPTPQIVHRLAAKPGEPLLLQLSLRVAKATARR